MFCRKNKSRYFLALIFLALFNNVEGQETTLRGFSAVETKYDVDDDELSFRFGEQDVFITSELSDKFSFLGETVFKYAPNSPTHFNVSMERVLVRYNFIGNHSVLLGKHHTPINYWNDSYHHGRLFFPTIERPEMFGSKIIPIHTSGVRLQGANISKVKFGYDILIGNGIGASEVADNDKTKSLTTAIHFKPSQGIRIGGSIYMDRIAAGVAAPNGTNLIMPMDHKLYSGSFAVFKRKIELLTEYTIANCSMDSETGVRSTSTHAFFTYFGYRFNKLVPYLRYDFIDIDEQSMYFKPYDVSAVTIGVRYEINHMTVVKLEYEYDDKENQTPYNHIYFQIAIGI